MKVVTSGIKYLDIDAYAGCVAYAELLQLQGEHALAVSTAPLNESVNKSVRSWNAPIQTKYLPTKDDEFILVDISQPDQVDSIVDISKVIEVIDHHVGFEDYWQKKIGNRTVIEFIGSVCTLIFEIWLKENFLEKMSKTCAKLLICGILDNTLNFGANVTTKRDIKVYEALQKIADLPNNWASQYFTECQEAILQNTIPAIKNDTKILQFQSYKQPIAVGQLAVWNGQKVISKYQDLINIILSNVKTDWFMNLINIEEQKSYFITDNQNTQKWLSGLIGVEFKGEIAIADRLWLRKEIVKKNTEKTDN